jgi:hypothetical protein
MSTYARIDHTCAECGAQAQQKDGIITVPHDEKCPVPKNPLLAAARGSTS